MSDETQLQSTEENEEMDATEYELATVRPPVDVFETEREFLVKADMPGLESAGIDVRLDKEQLIVEGVSEVDGMQPVRFARSFRVMPGLNPDEVRAEYKHGVLTVHLPKPVELTPRKIQVTAG